MDFALFNKIKTMLNSELAAAKLLLIRYGLSIAGNNIETEIAGYPEKFRTKRAKKTLTVNNSSLYDSETGKVPYVPEELFITVNGKKSVVKVNNRPESCFKLIIENGSLFVVSDVIDVKWQVELVEKNSLSKHVINNFPADNYVQVIGADRVAILGFDGCDEFYKKKECLFCDSNPLRINEKSARPTLNQLYNEFGSNTKNWLKTTDSYISACKDAYKFLLESNSVSPHIHLHIMAGNLPESSLEWEYMLSLSRALSSVKPLNQVDSYLNLLPPADECYLQKAFDIGFKKLIFNLEVFGENYFKVVCRGKHAVIPYPIFVQRMEQSSSIFGHGNIYCGFVLGAQPIDELKEGVLFLAKKGVVADYSVFTPKKGTAWENKSQPSIEEVADFSVFLADVYKKYGYKSLYCNLSSRSSIMSEL